MQHIPRIEPAKRRGVVRDSCRERVEVRIRRWESFVVIETTSCSEDRYIVRRDSVVKVERREEERLYTRKERKFSVG